VGLNILDLGPSSCRGSPTGRCRIHVDAARKGKAVEHLVAALLRSRQRWRAQRRTGLVDDRGGGLGPSASRATGDAVDPDEEPVGCANSAGLEPSDLQRDRICAPTRSRTFVRSLDLSVGFPDVDADQDEPAEHVGTNPVPETPSSEVGFYLGLRFGSSTRRRRSTRAERPLPEFDGPARRNTRSPSGDLADEAVAGHNW
jgi:hypothetical protein